MKWWLRVLIDIGDVDDPIVAREWAAQWEEEVLKPARRLADDIALVTSTPQDLETVMVDGVPKPRFYRRNFVGGPSR